MCFAFGLNWSRYAMSLRKKPRPDLGAIIWDDYIRPFEVITSDKTGKTSCALAITRYVEDYEFEHTIKSIV